MNRARRNGSSADSGWSERLAASDELPEHGSEADPAVGDRDVEVGDLGTGADDGHPVSGQGSEPDTGGDQLGVAQGGDGLAGQGEQVHCRVGDDLSMCVSGELESMPLSGEKDLAGTMRSDEEPRAHDLVVQATCRRGGADDEPGSGGLVAGNHRDADADQVGEVGGPGTRRENDAAGGYPLPRGEPDAGDPGGVAVLVEADNLVGAEADPAVGEPLDDVRHEGRSVDPALRGIPAGHRADLYLEVGVSVRELVVVEHLSCVAQPDQPPHVRRQPVGVLGRHELEVARGVQPVAR